MKLITVGFLKKIVDVKDADLKKRQKPGLDQLNLAMKTKHNPFAKPIRLAAKNPLNDPDFFVVRFERAIRWKRKSRSH